MVAKVCKCSLDQYMWWEVVCVWSCVVELVRGDVCVCVLELEVCHGLCLYSRVAIGL